MKKKALEQRILELEQRVRDLEARPIYHPIDYRPVQPFYDPNPLINPNIPPWELWKVTCGGDLAATTER